MTYKNAQFVTLMILMKHIKVKLHCLFTICDILIALATHYDTYISRSGNFFWMMTTTTDRPITLPLMHACRVITVWALEETLQHISRLRAAPLNATSTLRFSSQHVQTASSMDSRKPWEGDQIHPNLPLDAPWCVMNDVKWNRIGKTDAVQCWLPKHTQLRII